jgi:hypothetical protein
MQARHTTIALYTSLCIALRIALYTIALYIEALYKALFNPLKLLICRLLVHLNENFNLSL